MSSWLNFSPCHITTVWSGNHWTEAGPGYCHWMCSVPLAHIQEDCALVNAPCPAVALCSRFTFPCRAAFFCWTLSSFFTCGFLSLFIVPTFLTIFFQLSNFFFVRCSSFSLFYRMFLFFPLFSGLIFCSHCLHAHVYLPFHVYLPS